MAERGAPKGNDNGRKSNRLWTETLRRIAIQDPEKLRRIAEALYAKAEEGDVTSMREIGDRLDGKPDSKVDVTYHEGESLSEQQARTMAEEFLTHAARAESVG